MVEPTESESKAELDRFVDAMIAIRAEIREIEDGRDGPRRQSAQACAAHGGVRRRGPRGRIAYARQTAGWPALAQEASKYWPPVGGVDNVYGDRNLFCSCIPVDASVDR